MGLPFVSARLSRGGLFAASTGGDAGAGGEVTRESDLLHWWKFDEGSGTTAADSAGDVDLTNFEAGMTWNVSGRNGTCVEGDGTGDYLHENNGMGTALSGSYSMTAWFYPTTVGGNYDVIMAFFRSTSGAGVGTMLNFQASEKILFYHNSGAWNASNLSDVLSLDQWYFVAAVYDESASTQQLFWADADAPDADVTATTAKTSINALTTDVDTPIIAGAYNSASNKLGGRVDDARLYGVALTESNLNDIYNGGDGDWG